MDKSKILLQLKRIEGQVRGVQGMVETDRGLVPTLQQLMAIQSSLKTVVGNYVQLFLTRGDEGVELTQEQIEYILKLIGR